MLNSNDRFWLKSGTLLAQLGKAAFSSWARCLPRMGRFGFRYLPDIFPFTGSANACNSIHLTIPLISKPSRQLPDNRQTVNSLFVRILQQKTRQSDSFSEILAFAEIQRYGQLLLIKNIGTQVSSFCLGKQVKV